MAARRSTAGLRDANEILETAVQTNRRLGAVSLGLAVVAASAGGVCLVLGMVRGNWGFALAGIALGGLSWPAWLYFRRARDTNVVLQGLEAPLSMSDPDDEIADVLNGFLDDLGPKLWEAVWIIKPKHTFKSVVTELSEGLKDGTIVTNKARPGSS